MERILKQYTIVPESLYVERGADRQLKEILDDMQRPGYVLVARQMGKTNLLLNAKKKYESEDNIFTYIDLSNQFDNEKDCFENIIDRIIDTHEYVFEEAKEEIDSLRLKTNKSPQKEYSEELRVLLKYVKEKLVIILDEIDALTKTTYSDNIFAQIRSTYFDRVNYPVLNKLTYVLSGVVEPTEIIKNPKISPFNIGQKIFINDFSYEEFKNFIDKTRLSSKLSSNVINRIFYWTNGNPRMTWDLCYEVEDCLKDNLLESDVDNIVNSLYLTSYNTPPVDNIRELVINDRDLRDGVMQIHYGKENTLSDKIKNKLYLAGIINYNGKDVIIKNEIIKKSLSLDWLRKLEEDDKGLVKIAFELYANHDYIGCIKAFERFLSNSIIEDLDESNILYYHLGYAFYKVSEYEKALQYLLKCQFSEDEISWYYPFKNLIGLVYIYNNRISEALDAFKFVIDKRKLDEIYIRACVNYSILVCQNIIEDKYGEVELILKELVINDIQYSEKVRAEDVKYAKLASYYQLGFLEKNRNNIINSEKYYNEALNLANELEKPSILLALYNVHSNESLKVQIAMNLRDFLLKIERIEIPDPEKSMSFNADRFRDILLLFFRDYRSTCFEDCKSKLSLINNLSMADALLGLTNYSLSVKDNRNLTISILEEIYNNFDNEDYKATLNTKYGTLKILAYYDRHNIKYALEYIDIFVDEQLEPVDQIDIRMFSYLIALYMGEKKYKEILDIINKIEFIKETLSQDLAFEYLVIDHFKSIASLLTGDNNIALKISKELLLQLENTEKNNDQNFITSNDINNIKNVAKTVIHQCEEIRNSRSIIKINKYQRNDKVTVRYKNDQREVTTKFKNVEDDINAGKCSIINVQ